MRTHELAEANAHLKDLDRMKSMFIASMSHELRTPMNSILGFTDLILQGLSGEINEIQRDQLQRVHGAGKHLLMLISDIIDLSKVGAGKIEAIPSGFELEPLLDEAVQANLIAARKKGLSLVLARTIHKCYRALACSFVSNEYFVSRPYAWLRRSFQSIRC